MSITVTPVTVDHSYQHPSWVLLHGWGSDSGCWQSLLPWLQQQNRNAVLVDMDYAGESIDSLLAQLAESLPASCVLLGWSLGGMLAVQLAARYPQQVSGLITLAANARFVACADYSAAMPVCTFQQFYQSVAHTPAKARSRFARLQVHGSHTSVEQLPWVQQQLLTFDDSLLSGLALLSQLDNRQALTELQCPSLFIFGEKDALVPAAAAAQPCFRSEQSRQIVMPDRGHVLHYPSDSFESVLNDLPVESIAAHE